MNSQPAISILYASHTDIGKIRKNNQDYCAIRVFTTSQAKTIHLFCIADGLGGAPAGEVASKTAVDSVVAFLTTEADFENNSTPWLIAQAIELANIDITTSCTENSAYKNMGTTLTIAIVIDDKLYIGHIGDTRAYVLRQHRLVQMTVDHNVRQEKLDAGAPENEFLPNDICIVTRSLGSKSTESDIFFVQLRDGDSFILSTDGLHDTISHDEIKTTATTAKNDPSACCRKLIELANQAGGPDNITIVTAYFSGDGLQKPTDVEVNQLSRIRIGLDDPEPVSSEPITVRIDEKHVDA